MAQNDVLDVTGQTAMCRHHWVLDTPNGVTSTGRCKRCGTERDFRNSSEDLIWDSDNFSLGGSRYRGRRSKQEA